MSGVIKKGATPRGNVLCKLNNSRKFRRILDRKEGCNSTEHRNSPSRTTIKQSALDNKYIDFLLID